MVWVWALDHDLEGWSRVSCESGFFVLDGRSRYLYIVLSGYVHLRCTQCSILLHLVDMCFLPCICIVYHYFFISKYLYSTQFTNKCALMMADIVNPDLFVCSCRTWICLNITRAYEEQHQPSSRSEWLACPKTVNQAPIAGAGRFRHNLHSSL